LASLTFLVHGRAIGGRVPQFPDLETAWRVQRDYPIAAFKAFASKLAPPLEKENKKFRFVFLSGALAEWDQRKTLYFLSDSRKLKVSHGLLDFSRSSDSWAGISCSQPVAEPAIIIEHVTPHLD
jgi:hypothetical protein